MNIKCIAVIFSLVMFSPEVLAFTSAAVEEGSDENTTTVTPELNASENGVTPGVNLNYEIPFENRKHHLIAKAIISSPQNSESNDDVIDDFSATSGNYLAGIEYYYKSEIFLIGASGYVTKWNYNLYSDEEKYSASESNFAVYEAYIGGVYSNNVSLVYMVRYADLLSDDEINSIEYKLDGKTSSKIKMQIAFDQTGDVLGKTYVSANLIMPFDGSEAIFTIGIEKSFKPF